MEFATMTAFIGAGGAGPAVLVVFSLIWLIAMLFGAAFVFAFVKPYRTPLSKRRRLGAIACSVFGVLALIALLALWGSTTG
jgi:hypothetical protein